MLESDSSLVFFNVVEATRTNSSQPSAAVSIWGILEGSLRDPRPAPETPSILSAGDRSQRGQLWEIFKRFFVKPDAILKPSLRELETFTTKTGLHSTTHSLIHPSIHPSTYPSIHSYIQTFIYHHHHHLLLLLLLHPLFLFFKISPLHFSVLFHYW